MLIDGNMIMSGFVSKIVNEIVDIPGNPLKNAIKKADKDRKAKNQNIETRIYQVIIDAIKGFTKGTFKSEDTLYDAAEMIINAFRAKKESIEAVKAGLKMLESPISDDRCADFLGILCDEICKDENDILYKEIDLFQNEQISEDIHGGFKRSEQNQEYIREDIHKGFERSEQNHQETQTKLDYLVEKADDKDANFFNEIRVENRADEYAEKWEKNVFLNDFNKRDKNAGVNVKLKDIYLEEQLPHYIWKMNNEPSSDLKELLREYTIDNDGKKMLLILGQAGIGKSTLITWMIANFIEKKNDFLVYRFASDLKNIDWQGDNILSYILRTLKMRYDELENKVLILDGFDEINTNSDREKILNRINQELTGMNNLKNFSVVIICRENYVYELRKIECDFITLQVWDDDQIRCFCESYRKKSGSYIPTSKIDKLLENKEVFGIPLILYMVLALDITIEKSESLVDVYDQIFSIDRSSIYDRCINNSRYGGEHRISEDKIKQAIHQISQRIAFWIFENNSEEAYISKSEYEKICDTEISEISVGNESLKRDFLIGNYFKLMNHCDGVGTQELHFIHRSLYEYFVATYFFESLNSLEDTQTIAGKLAELLKEGCLSEQILGFIKYKFDRMNASNLPKSIKQIFQFMLKDGMTYHIEEKYNEKNKEKYKNIIVQELNVFANMLEVVQLWESGLGGIDNRIVFYLKCNHSFNLNLQHVELREKDLRGVDLIGANLSEANLSGANLSRTNLSGANLSRANLSKADLSRADLIESDLSGADLSEANLRETDLSGADLSGVNLSGANLSEANLIEVVDVSGTEAIGINLREANLSETIFDEEQVNLLNEEYDLSKSKVFVVDTREIKSYKDYCIRKQNG